MKLLSLETEFTFGQHKGQTVKTVLEKNNTYIEWLIGRYMDFCVTDEVFELMKTTKNLKNDPRRRQSLENNKAENKRRRAQLETPQYQEHFEGKEERIQIAEESEMYEDVAKYEKPIIRTKNKVKEKKFHHSQDRNPSIDEMIEGDEQMAEWYSSQERN